jgi:hypothetical protein
MNHIFINVNSTGPPPNRTQSAQKFLVLDMASEASNSNPLSSSFTSTTLPASLSYHLPQSFSAAAFSPTSPTLQTFPALERETTNVPDLIKTFLHLYYKRVVSEETSTEKLTAGNECGGWRLLLPLWLGQSTILDTAIGALAASFIGVRREDEELIDQGRNMYLKALQMVQQVLPDPYSANRKHLLATTLVMGSTELFLSNGGSTSQLAHIEGGTHLLENVSQTMNFEELHVYILNQGLFEAISTRRRYVFSTPSYRNSIRQMYSVPRTSRNDLFFQWSELILPLPNILHAADHASSQSSTPELASAILSILEDLTALEHSITPWYEQLKASAPGPWTFPTAQVSAHSVPFPLQFVSIEVCTLYCLHWASQLLILEARESLTSNLALAEEFPNAATATFAPQMTEYASLVCRSIQFCAEGKSYAAMENIMLPLFVVTSYYMRRGDEDRMRWCVGAFERITQEQKIRFI